MSIKKHVADVLTTNDIVNNPSNLICIISGVGSGKNWFIENKLSACGNILYITSRRAKVNEILEEKIAQEKITWDNYDNDIVTTTNHGIQKLVMNEKFGGRLSEIINHFSFIVVDEAHSIATDSTYTESAFHVKSFIDYIHSSYKNIKIILMTGTPEPINKMYTNIYSYDFRNICINIVPKTIRFIKRKEALAIMSSLPQDQKTIYYSNSAKKIINGENSLYTSLTQNNVAHNEICICMSENSIQKYKKSFSNLESICTETKQAIAQNHTFPNNKRFLLTTSTLKEGVNIEDTSIKVAFCETHLLSDIQQFSGRVRTTLDVLYIILDAKQHDVDENTYKANRLEAIFSAKKACSATNAFFNTYVKPESSPLYTTLGYNSESLAWEPFMDGDYSIYSYGGEAIRMFIKLIESKNQYIKFNHLDGKFNYYIARLKEQIRVHKSICYGEWVNEISNYCSSYDIDYIPPVFETSIDTASIISYLDEHLNIKLTGDSKQQLIDFLIKSFSLESDKPKVKTLNKKLNQLNIPYEIIKNNTTVNGKNTRYYQIIEH